MLRRQMLMAAVGLIVPFSVAQTVRGQRWLTVSSGVGNVQVKTGRNFYAATIGDRLSRAGQALATGRSSGATLSIDSAIGVVILSELTYLEVRSLAITPSGGRVTTFNVRSGQARIRARRFTDPTTRLEIHTPVGVARVRGTEFGVSIDNTGQTGLAALEGSVTAEAQGQSVQVNAQQQTLIPVGEPPLPPSPLNNDPFLDVKLVRIQGGRLRLVGHTDRVNLVYLDNELITTDVNGVFEVDRRSPPLRPNPSVEVLVRTPLGNQKIYTFG